MTFLNPSVLLNMGSADAVKTAASNTQSQESPTNASDEFAQALRKQMQQSSKPASVATGTDVQHKQPAKPVREPSTQTTAPSSEQQTKAATADTDEKPAQEVRDDDGHEDQSSVAKETSAANETPQERKKRLLAHLETTDATAGIPPWMQTMMAMRPAADKGISGDTMQDPLKGDALLVNATDVPVDVAGKALGVQLPADTAAADGSISVDDGTGPVVDSRQAATDEPNMALTGKDTSFTETLGIAKAVAAAVQQTAGADKAISPLNQMDADPAMSDPAQPVALPAAQALPNSTWLNAAGISQGANVVMSQIATPFGNERWQAAMNQHVLNMVGSGDDVASLTLSPPDLGPIQVVLKVDNQSVNTSFISDNPLVRQALEDGMQDLRDRMQSQGLALGQTFVGNGEQAQQHFGQPSPDEGGRRLGQAGQLGTDTVAPAAAVRTTPARGLVDTFV